jgi:glutathione S-transferase
MRRSYDPVVVLYTCSFEKAGGGLPVPFAHPCGRAAKALDDAGHEYEIKQVKGGTMRVWTWPSRGRDRAEVERLSGQRAVPILLLDDGEVIIGSGDIVSWAAWHQPAGAGAGA